MKPGYKVYFAGPGVFAKEAESFYHYVTSLAREAGFVPLIPWSKELPAGGSRGIFNTNLELLRQADCAVANLNPFHGVVEPDSGTVWELGYLFAQAKPVVGYMNGHDKVYNTVAMRERTRWRQKNGVFVNDAATLMPDGNYVEDFGLAHNLMIQHSLHRMVETLPEAIECLEGEFMRREDFQRLTAPS